MSDAPNLIDLLERQDNALLDTVRERHEGEKGVFSSGRMLGDEKASAKPALTPKKRAAIIDLIDVSISTLAKELDGLAGEIKKTMKRVSTIRYVGSLIATVSGGLAGILIIVLSSDVIQAITAFVAMLGGVAAVTADQFERAPSGIRIASAEEYSKIIEMRSNMELVRVKIKRDAIISTSDSDIEEMLANLDQFALSITKLKLA